MKYYEFISLILSTINLILIVISWIVLYKQSKNIEKQKNTFEIEYLKKKWEKEYIDQQVSSLYGPISQLLKEQNIRFNRILEMVGRDTIFQKNQYKLNELSDNDQKIWVHFVDTYKIPSNKMIVEILRNNRHLIFEAKENEDAINAFLDYAIGWELLDNQRKQDVPNYYEYYYCYNFPIKFTNYIVNTLLYLQEKQKELLNTIKE